MHFPSPPQFLPLHYRVCAFAKKKYLIPIWKVVKKEILYLFAHMQISFSHIPSIDFFVRKLLIYSSLYSTMDTK